MVRFSVLLFVAALAVAAASPITAGSDLKPSKQELDTSLRSGSRWPSDRRGHDKPSDDDDDDHKKDRNEKSRGRRAGRRNDDDDDDDDDDDREPRGKRNGVHSGKGPERRKRGGRRGNDRHRRAVPKCDPWDPECPHGKSGMKKPRNPGRRTRRKGPQRRKRPGRGHGGGKDPRPSPMMPCDPWDLDCDIVKDDEQPCDPWDPECMMKHHDHDHDHDHDHEPECDPWNPDCYVEDDDDEPACDPWDLNCVTEEHDDDEAEPACDPWDPECGMKEEEEPECDPWTKDCKRMGKGPRGRGPRGPKPRGMKGSRRGNNGVRRRRIRPFKGARGHGRERSDVKDGHSHGQEGHSHEDEDKGEHSHGHGNSREKRGGNTRGRKSGRTGKGGRHGGY